MSDLDKSFSGSIPKVYEQYLVPLIFEPYAIDLKNRLSTIDAAEILEIAAGTGVATRALASIPKDISITATDLNQAMLDEAATISTARPIKWQQADAMALPFSDNQYDAVVCQFGAMFFPDKSVAFSEVHRVLKPNGVFIFSVWDDISQNEFAETVTQALEKVFPNDPPRFMARTPHGYHDTATIARDLAGGGFVKLPKIDIVTFLSRVASAHEAAIAYCQGTPLRSEIEARDASGLNKVTDMVAAALVQKYGEGTIDGKIQALVITIQK